jgi:hypothetical protein
MCAFDRDLIRGGHYGQRSCVSRIGQEDLHESVALEVTQCRDIQQTFLGFLQTWHVVQPIRRRERDHCNEKYDLHEH